MSSNLWLGDLWQPPFTKLGMRWAYYGYLKVSKLFSFVVVLTCKEIDFGSRLILCKFRIYKVQELIT